MKIGIKAHLFNWEMRSRRKELGLTQVGLAEISGVGINDVQHIEQLKDVSGNIRAVNDKLTKIAIVLEVDFETLFPADYLTMLQEKKLPRRWQQRFTWCREVPLDKLPPNAEELLLPPPENTVMAHELRDAVRHTLESLPYRERDILTDRYGLDGKKKLTLEEIGRKNLITRERVRQIEEKAFTRLRHPSIRRRLRDHL
jgi:RNA polymerase sigma factor (sigma-70 family)